MDRGQLIGRMIGRLISWWGRCFSWSVVRLVGRGIGRSVGRSIGCSVIRLIGWSAAILRLHNTITIAIGVHPPKNCSSLKNHFSAPYHRTDINIVV